MSRARPLAPQHIPHHVAAAVQAARTLGRGSQGGGAAPRHAAGSAVCSSRASSGPPVPCIARIGAASSHCVGTCKFRKVVKKLSCKKFHNSISPFAGPLVRGRRDGQGDFPRLWRRQHPVAPQCPNQGDPIPPFARFCAGRPGLHGHTPTPTHASMPIMIAQASSGVGARLWALGVTCAI